MSNWMETYQDFLTYKNGVYYHTSGSLVFYHLTMVLGYGVENGLNYWLCQNSWGTNWGLQGFFKIKMGDCGIDKYVKACHP